MDSVSLSEAENRLAELADRADREHDRFTLTRNGRPHAVLLSVAEWKSIQETLDILADPQARADLAEAAEAEPAKMEPARKRWPSPRLLGQAEE